MRITIVGPAYPWRGGIPLLVTELAHRLSAAGLDVHLQTWSRQGPRRLLPAQRSPLTSPEAPAFPTTREPLSWRNPVHWWRRGRQIGRRSDLVVLVHYTTVQAPALLSVGWAARRRSRVVVLCANAVPHEPRVGDRLLTTLLMRSADAIVTHTAAERAALLGLTDRPVTVAALPPHLPVGDRCTHHGAVTPPLRRLLFFGKVRRYKGVDLLLRALAEVDDVRLRIVGEFYTDVGELVDLVARLGLTDRVEIEPDYLPADRIPSLFASVDALVLPYRNATASQLVPLAFRHGVPVIVTRVGNLPEAVRDDVDGLICTPGDVAALVGAITTLYEPGRLAELRAGVRIPDGERAWREYLDALTAGPGSPAHQHRRRVVRHLVRGHGDLCR